MTHALAIPAAGTAAAVGRDHVFVARHCGLDLMLFPAISSLLLLLLLVGVVLVWAGRPLEGAGVSAHRHRLSVLTIAVAQGVVVHRR